MSAVERISTAAVTADRLRAAATAAALLGDPARAAALAADADRADLEVDRAIADARSAGFSFADLESGLR